MGKSERSERTIAGVRLVLGFVRRLGNEARSVAHAEDRLSLVITLACLGYVCFCFCCRGHCGYSDYWWGC